MRRAFTLVELLVVVGIIAVLAAIAVPVYQTVRRSARTAVCTGHLQQLGVAIKGYQLEDRQNRFPGFLHVDPTGLRRGLADQGRALEGAPKDLWLCPFDAKRGADIRLNRPSAWDSGSENLEYLHEDNSSYFYEASARQLQTTSFSWFFPAGSLCPHGNGEWADGKAHQLRHQRINGKPIAAGRMPIVRCFYHFAWPSTGPTTTLSSAWTCTGGSAREEKGAYPAKVLNLAWDCSVFWSQPWWEGDLKP